MAIESLRFNWCRIDSLFQPVEESSKKLVDCYSTFDHGISKNWKENRHQPFLAVTVIV